MPRTCSLIFRTFAVAATLSVGVHAYADGTLATPSAAGGLGANVKSFLGNLGKGVALRQPYAQYEVVSRGVVPGRGPGYCLKGEPMPHLEGATNQVNLALIPCKTLEDSGAFQPVAPATTAGSAAGVTDGAQAPAADPSLQCTQYHVAVDNGTGDQYCMRRDGTVVGIIHYTRKADGVGYDMSYEPMKQPVSIGILKAGGSVGSDGQVVLPAHVQAGWDKVDRIQAEGVARVQAQTAANQAANADKAMMRKAAMEKCKPLIKGGDAQMTAFKACFSEATR